MSVFPGVNFQCQYVVLKMSLTYEEFQACVKTAVPHKFGQNWLNDQQDKAVRASIKRPVFIVAGPGTGKTTVLALRALKHIFVDGFSPESIIATTFTKKAASELRSRVLSWGVATQQEAFQSSSNPQNLAWLKSLDINQVKTGTLDALAQGMIADDRQSSEIAPAVIDSFMAKGLLRKKVIFPNRWHSNNLLRSHLESFANIIDFSDILKVCHSFADRVLHDCIDLNHYSAQSAEHKALADLVIFYRNYLIENNLMDFALLEQTLLEKIQSGRLKATLENTQAILVDEFQDTNFLQEQIYYGLCNRSNAALTVVGDDDQSIYRFRGATVEIFANFEERIQDALGNQWRPLRIDLVENYRSSSKIVDYFNYFVTAETNFHPARSPNKLPCIAASSWAKDPERSIPVLAMFRETSQDLATDICSFLYDIFHKDGRSIDLGDGTNFNIQRSQSGNYGDAVLLASTVQERTKPRGFRAQPRERLPLFIRQRMMNAYGVEVFNPRGRDLASIPEVMQCLGIMLECIDPNQVVQNSITTLKQNTINCFNSWRSAARQLSAINPPPGQLKQFIENWGRRHAPNMSEWPREWPLLELLFTSITWIPAFQNSPEGQVYLETVARTIAEASQVSSYRCQILAGSRAQESVKDSIREVFEPIAESSVEVDEDIMPYIPRAVFPIMTTHQAKGLEFPIVIVDIGSDYTKDHPKQRSFRYPEEGGNVHLLEDTIANFSPIGKARLQRSAIDRAFDDLQRLYFVAKSRPQNVLLLAGLTTQLRFKPQKGTYQVRSVATGDLRLGGRSFNFVDSNNWNANSTSDTIVCI